MEQQKEGFQQFQQKNLYFQMKKTIDQPTIKNLAKNNNKMIYKSPLTIYYGTNLCQLGPEIQKIPYRLKDIQHQEPVQFLQDQEIQPLKQFLVNTTKNSNASIDEQNPPQQERLNEYFPKKYMCVYNKFSQNLFLKNDLTIIIKNISRCIQLQMLIGFKEYMTSIIQEGDDSLFESQNNKKVQKKPIGSSPFHRKNIEVSSIKHNKKVSKGVVHKTFDELRIRKSVLKKANNNRGQEQQIEFFSNFESGNLHLAFVDKKNPRLFYLMLTNDINTHGCNQWFYFGIRAKGRKTYRFVIMNISKEFKYEENMKILCFSKGSWKRTRPYLCYKNKFLNYHSANLTSIDFEYEFNKQIKQEQAEQACQQVFFAFSYPYTYTKLLNLLKQITLKHYVNLFVTVQSLGKSQTTNYIPVIRIQASADKKISLTTKSSKPIILMVARQHASQTASSFIVQEIIKKLTDSSSQISQNLLAKYDFHIFPIANPDGVAHGNSRTNIKGYDINRCWQKGKSQITQQTAQTICMNKYIQNLLQTKTIDYTIDLHSHSKDFGSFAYFSEKNQISRLFSYFFCQRYQECRYSKCRVDLSYKKKQTFRGQMYYNLGIKNSITIQTSYYGYKKMLDEEQDQKQLIPFTLQNYSNIAFSILNAINEIQNYSKSSQKAKQVNSIIDMLNMKVARLKEKAKWKGQLEDSNSSDSAPQQDFLQVKQRKQMGQNIPQVFVTKNESQKQQQIKKQPVSKQKNLFLTQSNLESEKSISQSKNTLSQTEKEGNTWNQKLRKKKRKRIYTNSNVQNIISLQERVSSSLNHQELTQKYEQLDKQLEKRSTLRSSIKFGSSKSLGYRGLSEHKKKIQDNKSKNMVQQQKTIYYPTACDINLTYANIRIMHEEMHKNRIKVKDIKNQTLLRKFRNQDTFNKGSSNKDLIHMKQTLSKLSRSFVTGSTIKKLQY